MTTIKGIELDLLRSSNNDFNWQLVFTSGSFLNVNTSFQIEPTLIRLNKSDYSSCSGINACLYKIYYNPLYDKYSIVDQNEDQDECHSHGYLIGGFQVKNCKMFFVSPNNCKTAQYERNFSPEYDKSFLLTEFECKDDDCYVDFNNLAFNEAFDTRCIIGECDSGAFGRYGYDNSYNSQGIDCGTNTFGSGFNDGYENIPVANPNPVPPPIVIRSFDSGFDSGFGS